ncbi:hypothetical protein C8R45DRAFT_957184 [Mycena sanguinolenta]|nr:hypothetical protein C8R45DRAFT_957184 [Mycena sanguinolenta]
MGDNSQPEPSTSTLPPSSSAAPESRRNAQGRPRPKYVEQIDNPTVEFLKALGIKARDFHYEGTLPPVAPYVRPDPPKKAVAGPSSGTVTRQPRKLKRTLPDGTEVEDNGYGFVMGVARTAPDDASRPWKMLRLDAEASQLPGGSQASLPPRREATLLSLDDEAALRAAAYEMFGGSQSQSQSQGYYYSQGNSQDTDGIPTPIVTPNGSLVWIGGPPLVPTEPASAVPTEPNSAQGSTSSVPLALPESPTPASRRRASPLPPRPQPLRRASPFPSQLHAPQLQPLPTGAPTPPASPPATLAPAPLTINTSAPPPPAPTLARIDVQPLLRTFSSLSTFSSPLSEPPLSAPRQPPTPSPPPRYQLRKRSGATASSARTPKRRRPAPRREESLTLVIQS